MKTLHDQARRVIVEGNAADTSVSDSQERIWQALSSRLDAPLPPGAAAANHALQRRPGARASTSALSSARLKLVIWGVVLGGLGGGLAWYGGRRAADNTATTQLQQREVAAPVLAAPAEPTTPEAAPASGAVVELPAPSDRARPRRALPAPASLAAETKLIAAAQSALADGAAARALALLERHRSEYPRGELIPEREAARVLALCALSREAEAQAARRRFERSWPSSPLLSRVRGSCSLPAE